MAPQPANEETPCLEDTSLSKKLLPIKLHFILVYGAGGGVIPYMSILGKQLGLTATAIGIVYTAQPFALLFSKPIIGALTDHLRSLKLTMIMLAIIMAIAFSSVLFISPLPRSPGNSINLECISNESVFKFSGQHNSSCVNDILDGNLTCNIQFETCMGPTDNDCNITCAEAINTTTNTAGLSRYLENDEMPYVKNLNAVCSCGKGIWNVTSCTPDLHQCIQIETHDDSVYKTYQFWAFLFLVMIAGSSAGALYTLSDAACFEIIDDKTDLFGKQRLWATTSWGIVTMSTGYLNEWVSRDKNYIDYGPGFYIMLVLLFFDIILLCNMNLKKTNFTPTIWKDVGNLFASPVIVVFTIGVFIAGALTGLLWSYEFWYLEYLGATQLLLGLAVAVQCLCAEVPFFFISGYMLRIFGYYNCLVLTFAAHSLRYILYAFLKNPWYVLPIELLHGQTYANFFVTMTSFANGNAPPGTEATMIGLLGGVFEGLGVAVGSLLSGVGFDHIGGATTFFIAGIVSAVCGVLLFFIFRCIVKTQDTNAVNPVVEVTSSTAQLHAET